MAEASLVMQRDPTTAMLRQAGMLIGIAASVALGVYVVMWAQTPNYTLLYSDLSDRDVSQVADSLQSSDIPYRIDPSSGAVLIASSRVHDAKMRLASDGLPKGAGMGFELMDQDQGFGTSQFLERARYQRAVEGELSRSIARINNVRSARVHLGLPPETAFSRSRKEPSASVIVDLYPGRKLAPTQVGAITHLVSASVPNLPNDKVTVVDQAGNLLTDLAGNEDIILSGKRFDYQRRIEQSYVERIQAILMPFAGTDGVRAEVNADIDFTTTEQTRETFNPDLPAIRSERLLEEERVGSGSNGVPGALSNEPPLEAAAPEEALPEDGAAVADGTEQSTSTTPGSKRSQSTRNYELDRTISHTKPSTGTIRRLSVAVVVRDKAAPSAGAPETTAEETSGEEPSTEQQPALAAAGFSDEDIQRMTNLVKESVGFDINRGDTVSVTAVEFLAPPTPAPLPEIPIWKQTWVWDVAKQVAGGIFVLILVFAVLRPTMKNLMKRQEALVDASFAQAADGSVAALPAGEQAGDQQPGALAPPGEPALLAPPESQADVDQIRQFVQQDPKVSAQIVKGWVKDE